MEYCHKLVYKNLGSKVAIIVCIIGIQGYQIFLLNASTFRDRVVGAVVESEIDMVSIVLR